MRGVKGSEMANSEMGGRKDITDRLTKRKQGQWSTVSSDLLYLASMLYRLSEKEVSTSIEGGTSKMVFNEAGRWFRTAPETSRRKGFILVHSAEITAIA